MISRWAHITSRATSENVGAREALAEALMALSSTVHLGHEGIWIEVSRSVTLFGSEQALAHQALRIAELLEHQVTLAIADEPHTARILSRTRAEPILIVPTGRDAEALAGLALVELGAEERAIEYLAKLGVRRTRELARLTPEAIRKRLGPDGEQLVRIARAEPSALPERYVPPERPEVIRELEPPVPPSEAVLFVVKSALDELVTRLSGRAMAIEALQVSLHFEGDIQRAEELQLPRALRSTAPLLAVLRERLFKPPEEPEEEDEGAAVARVTEIRAKLLRAVPAPTAQLSLLSRQELDTEELA